MPPNVTEPGARPGLGPYLHGHHLAATVGVAVFERASRAQASRGVRDELTSLTREVDEDRVALAGILRRCGLEVTPLRRKVSLLAARARTVAPRNLPGQPRELADLLELEALTAAVHAKLLGWLSLRHCVDDSRLDDQELDRLIHRAEDQESRLEQMRREAALLALRADG